MCPAGCAAHIGQQIRQYLANPWFVGHDDQPVRALSLDRAAGFDGARVSGGVAHQDSQISLGQIQRGRPVQPRELQQLGDQPAHSL